VSTGKFLAGVLVQSLTMCSGRLAHDLAEGWVRDRWSDWQPRNDHSRVYRQAVMIWSCPALSDTTCIFV